MRLKYKFFHTKLVSCPNIRNKQTLFPNGFNITFASDLENSRAFSYNLLVLYFHVSISTSSLSVFMLDCYFRLSHSSFWKMSWHFSFIFYDELSVILWNTEMNSDGMLKLNLYFKKWSFVDAQYSISYKKNTIISNFIKVFFYITLELQVFFLLLLHSSENFNISYFTFWLL